MTSPPLRAEEQLTGPFLEAAARGDLPQLGRLLSRTPELIHRTADGGWTALMLAARNGHYDVAEALLCHGCDKLSVNSSSQTAYDIAKFWGHRRISDLLAGTDGGCSDALAGSDRLQPELYFSRETLDRQSGRRTDKVWLEAKRSHPGSVYLLFCHLAPMVSRSQHHETSQVLTKLCRFSYDAVRDLVEKPATKLIFLGVEKKRASSSQRQEGFWEAPAWFALGTEEEPAQLLQRCAEKNCYFPTSPNRDLLAFSEEEAGVVAQARSVLAWHDRHSFCPTCGGGSSLEEGGYKRSCLKPDCRSRQGVHSTCYPRVDPVVIVLVIHPDGNQCLLGRKKNFPVGTFSCLAGFIEPGEAIEDAVRREVEEESAVKVGPVRYVCCQPWPMPSNLMIGCLAVATSTDVRADQEEIEEARWFTRQQAVESLQGGARPALTVPPRQTIAHQLIRYWIGMNANL